MKKLIYLSLIIAFLSGCGSPVPKGTKIYCMTGFFDGKTANEKTGTSVFENGKIKNLYRYYKTPAITKDGKKLAAFHGERKDTLVVKNLETGVSGEYKINNISIMDFEWNPVNQNEIYYVGGDYDESQKKHLFNIYKYSLLEQKKVKITNLTILDRRISDFSISPDGKKIAYSVSLPKHSAVKILNVESGEEKQIPFSTRNLDWSPDGKTIAISGIYYDSVRTEYGNRIIFYDVKADTYRQIEKPGGDKAYLWISDLEYSPDGKKIAFVRHENSGAKTLWVMNADGTNRKKIHPGGGYILDLSWTEG